MAAATTKTRRYEPTRYDLTVPSTTQTVLPVTPLSTVARTSTRVPRTAHLAFAVNPAPRSPWADRRFSGSAVAPRTAHGAPRSPP